MILYWIKYNNNNNVCMYDAIYCCYLLLIYSKNSFARSILKRRSKSYKNFTSLFIK